jgi:hypothetical protein
MSLATLIIANATLASGTIVLLVYVCRIPFRVDRTPAEPALQGAVNAGGSVANQVRGPH